MNTVRYVLTPRTLNVQLEGVGIFQLSSDNPKYDQAVSLARELNFEGLKSLLHKNDYIANYFVDGEFTVQGRSLLYKGNPVHGYVAEKAVEFVTNNLPARPLFNFIERLMLNPSKRATEELYSFLEHRSMPITDDGCFLAYKGVNADYSDRWTGRFFNYPGAELTMVRSAVDDDARVGCSSGFHAGSLQYAASYMGPEGRLMIVKIDPKDVVSVPYDCDCQKLRTCRYTVVEEYQGELPDLYWEEFDEDIDEEEEGELWDFPKTW